jgi:hypothetical protein
VKNDRHVVTLYDSTDGKVWKKYGGSGEVRVRNVKYRAL